MYRLRQFTKSIKSLGIALDSITYQLPLNCGKKREATAELPLKAQEEDGEENRKESEISVDAAVAAAFE